MSWTSHSPLANEPKPGDELFDGVRLERRDVLLLSLGTLAALILGRPEEALSEAAKVRPRRHPPTGRDLSWDALIEQAVPMAQSLVQCPMRDENVYLRRLSALVTRLAAAPDALFEPDLAVASVNSFHRFPFVVMQFRLAPGAAIPYHDHRDYNGVLSAITGEARVRSFEIVSDDQHALAAKAFQIRETHEALVTPGHVSMLSRTRDNIHDVRAGRKGARLIDFFTFFNEYGRSVYLNVGECLDSGRKIFEARWTE